MKKLIVIAGPTASGKTALSISLAKELNTCILSADSRQFYREISIGTAKPSKIEQNNITHYFIDSHDLSDEVSAAQYEREALKILEEEFQTKDQIVLVGGSGMFIDALCFGLDPIPTSESLKKELQEIAESNEGISILLEELKNKDPEYFNSVDKSNTHRIIRAIEAITLTGQKYSDLRKNKPKNRFFESYKIIINQPREVLYERINKRVDVMIEEGLVDEVKSVIGFKHLTSMNTVGYKEIFEFLEKKITLEESIELIKRNTRRYAKRQLTWFRRDPESLWITPKSIDDMIAEIKIFAEL